MNKNGAPMTVEQIQKMSYVEFISFLRETNRCPGGKNTVRRIIQNTFIDKNSKVLEVGSNTGFTSLELARTAKCSVVGIDVVPESVAESKRVLAEDTPEIQKLVRFEIGTAYEIPFAENAFDVLVVGGATSFMEDKSKAVAEYHRVLRPWGFLSVTTLAYANNPPASVVDAVSKVIGVRIQPWNFDQWSEVFSRSNLFESYYCEKYRMHPVSSAKLDAYIEYFLKKPHISHLSLEVKAAIGKRWRDTLDVFNENHKYLGFLFMILRKRHVEEEPELFTEYNMME